MPIRSSPAPSAATASSTSFSWSSAFGVSETPTRMPSAASAAEQRQHEQEDVEDVEEDRRRERGGDSQVGRPLQPVEVEDRVEAEHHEAEQRVDHVAARDGDEQGDQPEADQRQERPEEGAGPVREV